MIKPTGKTIAAMVRIKPGAFVVNHGDGFVERASAHPNPKRGLPMNELTNILSRRIRAFFTPILETSSVVCAGVKASIVFDEKVFERKIC